MLAIRLARTGRKKYPTYRIVAAESSRATTGKFVAILGHYNPHTKELIIKKDETLKHLSHGAQPSNAVIKLLQREKIDLPKWVKLETWHRAPKKAAIEAAPAAAVAETIEPAEAPETVATEAEANAEIVESKAIADTDEDSDHTETAATEEAQLEAAEAADDVAAESAVSDPAESAE